MLQFNPGGSYYLVENILPDTRAALTHSSRAAPGVSSVAATSRKKTPTFPNEDFKRLGKEACELICKHKETMLFIKKKITRETEVGGRCIVLSVFFHSFHVCGCVGVWGEGASWR